MKQDSAMENMAKKVSRPPRMLIADDDPGIVRLLADRCIKAGFDVVTAADGLQALLRAKKLLPDILIIDVNMPNANGLTVCSHLLKPMDSEIKIIVVTGRRDPYTISQCEDLGIFYTHKGFNFWRDLVSALTKLFPDLKEKIKELDTQSKATKIRERPCVLLIDDDGDVKKFFHSRFAKHGVEMLFAYDGVQGYRMACREHPSVIISDYSMPGGDALHLLWRLRTTRTTQKIPVLILSAKSLDDSVQQILKREICGHSGATALFRKSFDVSELFVAVNKYCAFEEQVGNGH